MLDEFGIRSKVQNIVTDNAANMSEALKVAVKTSEVNYASCSIADEPEEDWCEEANGMSNENNETIEFIMFLMSLMLLLTQMN